MTTNTSGASASDSPLDLRAQDQEGLAEARERQHSTDTYDDPERGSNGFEGTEPWRRLGSGGTLRRLAHTVDEHKD